MRKNINHHLSQILPVLLVVIFACDIVGEDSSPRHLNATLYGFAGKPMIINTASFSGGLDLRAATSADGQFGTITPLLDGKYLMYTPTQEFAGKEEKISIQMNTSSNRRFSDLDLTLRSLDLEPGNCDGLLGVYDYAEVSQGNSLVIDLLDNDVFCNVGYNGGIVNAVTVEGIDQDYMIMLGPGRTVTFNYTPPPGFTGTFKVLYNVGINWKYNSGHNEATSEEILANPTKYLEGFTTSMLEINVVQ